MITHKTTYGAVESALQTIAGSANVVAPPVMIPMEAK
jgi:predicted RNA methylase